MIRAIVAVTLFVLAASTAIAAELTIGDGRSQPESITATLDGDVIAGSFSSPKISIVRKGSTATDTFADLTADGGGTTLGVLADGVNNTLWACNLTSGPTGRGSNVRGFDLKTGAPKVRWNLPDPSTCNDFSVAPDKSLYIADTSGKIYRLPAGATSGELVSSDPATNGIDGIAFLDGALYFDNINSGKVYRLPLDAAGKASAPVEIKLDTTLSRPDGMRAANGKLFLGEGGGGKVDSLTIDGDKAHVTVVKDGLQRPTAVAPNGDMLWYSELTPGKVTSIPMPK